MVRRWRLATFVVVTLLIGGLTALPGGQSSSASAVTALGKPNVVVLLLDDVTVDAVPHTPALMPYLQARLGDPADHWVQFTNAFLNTPICCPTRATLFTGRYSHNHGVETNGQGPELDDTSTIATWMHDAGYFTSLFGKYINLYPHGRSHAPPGWDQWSGGFGLYYDYDVKIYDVRVGEGITVEAYGAAEEDYEADVIARKAAAFVDGAPALQPFFLYLAPKAWHDPYIPAPRYDGVFAGLAPTRKPSFNEADVSDKPAWVQQIPMMTAAQVATQDDIRRRAYETLPAVDDALKSTMDAIERRGELDNTVVIVMSDNGFAFGEHRWKSKKCAYEECIRTPLYVRYPGATPHTDARLVSSVDIAQTIAEIGAAIPATSVDGRSLVPLLHGDASPWRAGVLLHTIDDLYSMPGYWGVRTRDFVYVEYTTGDKELYDFNGRVGPPDPYQLDNRADRPRYAAIQAALADLLTQLKSGSDPNEEVPPSTTTTVPPTTTTVPTGRVVTVTDTAFTPAITTSAMTTGVEWTNRGTAEHNVTESVGLGVSGAPLFNSGTVPVNGAYRYSFKWAATFAYRDATQTSLTGAVKVPIVATPDSGSTNTVFTLRLASAAPPPHIKFDVQIRRPGASSFSNWATGVTATTKSFRPSAAGNYLFRARVRTTSGKTSGWSPAKQLSIHYSEVASSALSSSRMGTGPGSMP